MQPDIILGPPGTGKTTTLLNLVEGEMADGVDPERIGYITFTRKGATEAAERAQKKFNFSKDQMQNFRTIHSLCFRRLGMHTDNLLAGKSFFEFASYAEIDVTGRAWSDDGTMAAFKDGDRILFMENLARIKRITLKDQYDLDHDGLEWHQVRRVSEALGQFKKSRGLLDYTDMLLEFVARGRHANLERLFVDESQDLSTLQWEVVRLLSSSCDRVVVAGDDDQAIYEWAGADVPQFVEMKGQVTVLGQSWRVPKAVQRIADNVISGVRQRRTKTWKPREDEGVVDHYTSFGDAGLDKGSVLVLARNKYILDGFAAPALKAQGIVFEQGGKSSLDANMVRSAYIWEDLKKHSPITLGEARVMYQYISLYSEAKGAGVARGFKTLKNYGDDESTPVTLRDLLDTGGLRVDPSKPWFEVLDRVPPGDLSYMRKALRSGEKIRGGVPRVKLSTIHSIKGGEADHVVIFKEMAQRTYNNAFKSTRAEDEERRVWYVGVTRAKRRLSIIEGSQGRSCPWV